MVFLSSGSLIFALANRWHPTLVFVPRLEGVESRLKILFDKAGSIIYIVFDSYSGFILCGNAYQEIKK